VECGRGLAMSHILGKMSYSHKYLNVLNLLNVFTLGPDLKTSHDIYTFLLCIVYVFTFK
jgi:uncharacterized membrane protein